jgi:calcineurin-like phosphoesterase family protein
MTFTSDTHFGDHRTINIHRRPFASTDAMDLALVSRWNAVVSPDDVIWHLGDFARSSEKAAKVLAQLNGRKHLVRGNNDSPAVSLLPDWETVHDYAELEYGERLLILCHYPFRSWNGQHRKSINLHGHSHGRLKAARRQVDVGVDAHAFRPISIEEVVSISG